MKVLQLGKFYPIRGGVEKVMYDLMLGLSSRKINCDMLCATTEGYEGGELVINEYAKVMAVKTSVKLASTMLAPSLIFKLKRIAKIYDVIHIHHPDPMVALALWMSGFKGKVVLHWHSDILKQKNLLKLYQPLQNWLINRADVIVGTTPVYVKESPFLQQVQQKIDYIPIGVPPIVAREILIHDIKEKYSDKKLIFSLGRLVEYKGYEYLIRAAKELDDSYHIVIGGKGPLQEDLQSLIISLQVQDKVTLYGFMADEDVCAYFHACYLFCLSSIWKTEAFAIVQIEAMSCAKPVISTAIPQSGVSWVNKDGESGLVVKPENPSLIADAIKRLGEDEEYYMHISNRSLNRYKNFFTSETMISKTLSVYNSVLY